MAALIAARAGDAPVALLEARAAVAMLDTASDPLLNLLEIAIRDGHSAAGRDCP